MKTVSREEVATELVNILKEFNADWEYSGEITPETTFFSDLGFESIDIVAFGTAIEEHYRKSFPFAEFLMKAGEREAKDIKFGEVVALIRENLSGSAN